MPAVVMGLMGCSNGNEGCSDSTSFNLFGLLNFILLLNIIYQCMSLFLTDFSQNVKIKTKKINMSLKQIQNCITCFLFSPVAFY